MKKKEITLQTIADSIHTLSSDVKDLSTTVDLLRLDSIQLRKDLNKLDERTLDMQEDIHIIVDILKDRDNRIGLLELAVAPTPR
ncbi:MAG: hypothetical protein KBD47_03340 [Candidatus Pacebacteria bacterium]|jgi:chromosome segregation ATPase|nr:hypothetical protein [Candidatus Paceibacterota bacterium]